MNNKVISGGKNVEYESSALIHLSMTSVNVQMKFRNENTDGKFMTNAEYIRHIRIKKLKEIENENNS